MSIRSIKEKYCTKHKYIAWYNYSMYITMYIHGVVRNHMYISVQYGDFGTSYHKLKIYGIDVCFPYIRFGKVKIYLKEFILRSDYEPQNTILDDYASRL